MWDDDFYKKFLGSGRDKNPFDNFWGFNNNRSYDPYENYNTDSSSHNHPFKTTKFVTITVSEGDDDSIDDAIKILESMKSKKDDSLISDTPTFVKEITDIFEKELNDINKKSRLENFFNLLFVQEITDIFEKEINDINKKSQLDEDESFGSPVWKADVYVGKPKVLQNDENFEDEFREENL
mgnify:FL=1